MLSPYTRCSVGRPRRRAWLSIAGRSSTISELVCRHSIAHAVGSTSSIVNPSAWAVAMTSTGRTRLPPARSA